MSRFFRNPGRHVRRGSYTGWGALAQACRDAAAHPVVNVAITRPVTTRQPYGTTPRSAA
ncbi:hypothetical protein [Microbispora rosea]|uniref:hypothetical protein n=1 Tax=Microbispora rosea TaxID=58117 RepID=UPI00379E6025